jgi:glycosyltransferase involved in cell wall biosynthesis
MPTIFHQLQGLYTAGDVLCAVDCVRAIPEYNHTFFVNHDDWFDERVFGILTTLGVDVRRNAIITEADITHDLRAIFYHCVGYDDQRRGEYIRFWSAPPGVNIYAWIHTPGLCGDWAERYNYLHERAFIGLLFDSTFSMHHTTGIDRTAYASCSVVYPGIDAEHYAAVQRADDGAFRIGRWSRGHDSKYSDDFLDLLASIHIPEGQIICMGIPDKFRNVQLPPHIRLLENGALTVEELLAQLDILIFKTHAPSWHEGWCRTVTEAMAAGVVPVVENRGGLADQVIHGYNGFLCDTNDEFKRYCELLYRNADLRTAMSANARAFARENLGLASLRQDLLRLVQPAAPRRLNYGCGFDIRPDYVNFDIVGLPGVDVVAAIDPYNPRLPFGDEEFDEIIAFHVLEHVANKQAMIEEIWRIARHNAVLKIKLPDRRHSDAFVDPTHLSYWEVDTIDFYLPGHLRSYYSPAKFGLLRKHTSEREIYWEVLAMRRQPDLRP